MKQAHTFGWLRFFHATALCVLAAPALAADDVNLRSLSPPSGTLAGVRRGEALGPVNSVEATIRYRLQSTPQGFITITGVPPTSYPITMSPMPPIRFSNGNGDVRIRFSWLCNDRSPSSNPLPAVTITMRGVDARGVGTGVLVQKTQPVNYTFTCRPPSQIKRPSDAALTTPGESPSRGLLPPRLLPDLHIRNVQVNDRCQIVITVENLGPGPLPDSAWSDSYATVATFDATGQVLQAGQFIGRLGLMDPGRQLRNPGGSATYTSTFTIPVSTATWRVTVDTSNAVNEANEGNNFYVGGVAGISACRAAARRPAPTPMIPAKPPLPGAPSKPSSSPSK